MTKDELISIKQHYAVFSIPVFCCNLKMNIIWENDAAKEFKQDNEDFSELIFFHLKHIEKNEDFFTFTVTGEELLARLICSRLPEDDAVFVQIEVQETASKPSVLFDEINQSLKSQDFIDIQYRNSVNNILNLIPHIYHDLEQHELYNSIKYLKNISSSAYKILKTTLNYTEYRRLISDEHSIHKNSVNITKELEQLFTIVKANLFRSNVDFSYRLPSAPIIMTVDVEKLNVAILNLISNACQYSGTQNTVAVDVFVKNESLVIQVTDKGVGIPPGQYEKVFIPFYSYDPSTGSQSGIGLGLSYAYMFAKRMNGSCIITGSKNSGTCVILKLPLGKPLESTDQLASNSFKYSTGRFSPVSIFLSDTCEVPID